MNTRIDSSSTTDAIHPIQVVARRTGLSADVIRAWERRHNAVSPQRSPTSRRLYSDEDLERLSLLRQVVQGGRRIGDVAHLSSRELANLAQVDSGAVEAPPLAVTARSSDLHVDACLAAVRRLDALALDTALADAALALSTPALLETVINPLMARIGDEWRAGLLRSCHEHLATSQLRSFLGHLVSTTNLAGGGPDILITTPTGQRHELGALMVAVIAALSGWNAIYLGPDIPSDEIAYMVSAKSIRAVALSISYPADDPRLPDALRRLRRQLPPATVLFVGGAAVVGYRHVLAEIAACQPPNLGGFQFELDQLRAAQG